MGIANVRNRARLAQARKLHSRQKVGAGGTKVTPRSSAKQTLINVFLVPLGWLQSGLQELIGWLDRRTTPKVRVRVPWPEGKPFLVIGHRGSPAKKVENTLDSLREAVDIDNANAVEIDLVWTKDGEVAVYHDWDPDEFVAFARQHGAEPIQRYRPITPPAGDPWRRPTPELTLAELRAHYGFATMNGKRPVVAHIPSIGEVFEWAHREPRLRAIFLDMKVPKDRVDLVEPMVARIRTALRRHPVACRLIVLSPYPEILGAFRAQAPEWALSLDIALPPGAVPDPSQFSALAPAKALANPCASIGRPPMTFGGWKAFRKIVEDDMESLSRDPGPPRDYIAWTLNVPSELRQVLDIGVHGILTDKPARLHRLALRAGRPL